MPTCDCGLRRSRGGRHMTTDGNERQSAKRCRRRSRHSRKRNRNRRNRDRRNRGRSHGAGSSPRAAAVHMRRSLPVSHTLVHVVRFPSTRLLLLFRHASMSPSQPGLGWHAEALRILSQRQCCTHTHNHIRSRCRRRAPVRAVGSSPSVPPACRTRAPAAPRTFCVRPAPPYRLPSISRVLPE